MNNSNRCIVVRIVLWTTKIIDSWIWKGVSATSYPGDDKCYGGKQAYKTWNRFYVHLPVIGDLHLSLLVQIASLVGSSHLPPLVGQNMFCELQNTK